MRKLTGRTLSGFLTIAMLLGNAGYVPAASSDSEGQMISEYFSDRDFEVGYEESESALIRLDGDSAQCSSDAVEISGTTITIRDEGTYILSGTLENGMIIVNTDKKDKTQLVLDNANINSETSAAIYILQSDKVFITTAADTENTLSNGGTFTAIDENNIDAVIYSKEDVTLNGSGTLVITSPTGHGIVSKDSLTITSGNYDINCASQALDGKDDVCIANADFTIVSGKDGIHAENEEDADSGYIYIQSGTFDITAEGDGISASGFMQIEDGEFHITSGGGSENAAEKVSKSWGNFMGGGKHKDGVKPQNGKRTQDGEIPENGEAPQTGTNGQPEKPAEPVEGDVIAAGLTAEQEETEEDSTSMKGLKSSSALVINGGSFSIDSADDSVHSNASVTVNGGTFEIAAGDDAFHGDENLTITDGIVNISKSYEGLEALHVTVSGGTITLTASDDGINAAGGTDESGKGGRDAMGGPGMQSSSGGSIVISGGSIQVTAYGDGIDANGSVEITGGDTVICGPVQGDTSTLDYDTQATISGGTFIGTGASGMAQTFRDSEQGVISVRAGSQTEGTAITLTDSDGNTLLTCTPELAYEIVILSSPDIRKGETYTVTVGTDSKEFTAV